MHDGQEVTIYNGAVTTLTGKRGTLTIRDRNEWVYLARDGNGDGEDDGIGIGTWKVTRGTGQYAGVTGGGRGGSVWLERTDHWSSHDEGVLAELDRRGAAHLHPREGEEVGVDVEAILAVQGHRGALGEERGDRARRQALDEFAASAKTVLRRRVANSPPERGEARWLSGWLARVDGYAK
jgi:hypothetical protein